MQYLLSLPLAWALSFAENPQTALEMRQSAGAVEITHRDQRLRFALDGSNSPALKTSVRTAHGWAPFFDATDSFLSGPGFKLAPTACRVVEDSANRKAARFSGVNKTPSFPWALLVEADAANPMVRFTLTMELEQPVALKERPTSISFWRAGRLPEVVVNQGPTTIYENLHISETMSFPCAYLWDGGKEAVVFFDMTPLTWLSPKTIWGMVDLTVRTREEAGRYGIGLHTKKVTGAGFPAGELRFVYYLYAGPRSTKPDRLAGLDKMIEVAATQHPATAVFPENHEDSSPVTWEHFAERAIRDLMDPRLACAELNSPWTDGPLSLVDHRATMMVHSGAAEPRQDRRETNWDFSTVNNHLTPWILFARLHDDRDIQRFAWIKKDALPRFYDPGAKLIRHGATWPPHVGPLEMSWQNLFFHLETMRAARALPADQFNPAIQGRFLMAMEGLRQLAEKNDYVLPQWFDAATKEARTQNDVPRLGIVREPMQLGTYAYVMMDAYELTGRPKYLDEAQHALSLLFKKIRWRVQNELYDRTYSDVVDFPITELFGNAFGAAAAQRVYARTGEAEFDDDSRHLMNILLRLTFWYESEIDAVSRDLKNLGLFYPHGGAHVSSPWETLEANMGLISMLKYNPADKLRTLYLKLTNFNRVHSFYFHPAVYTEAVRSLEPNRRTDIGQYWPIEPFYSLEGGPGGHQGQTAAYMAGLTIWNYWLYEALADADQREVMVVNLDAMRGYDRSIQGIERRFIAFNPTNQSRRFMVRHKHLPARQYKVALSLPDGSSQQMDLSAEELIDGIPIALGPRQDATLVVRAERPTPMEARWRSVHESQSRLSVAYADLQTKARDFPEAHDYKGLARDFRRAYQGYRNGDYDGATDAAAAILLQLEK